MDIAATQLSLGELIRLAIKLHTDALLGMGTTKNLLQLKEVFDALASNSVQKSLFLGPLMERAQTRENKLGEGAVALDSLNEYARATFKPDNEFDLEMVFKFDTDLWIIVGGGIAEDGTRYPCEVWTLVSDFPRDYINGKINLERCDNEAISEIVQEIEKFLANKKKSN